MRALPPPTIITARSAFERRASARFLRRPRTGKIATSAITRLYAEKAAQTRMRAFCALMIPQRYQRVLSQILVPRGRYFYLQTSTRYQEYSFQEKRVMKTVADQLQKPSPQALPANAHSDHGCDGDDC